MVKLTKKVLNKRGQALVEFALILPIVLMLILGIIEFGRIFSAHLIVSNASREGARYAAIGQSYDEVTERIENRTSTLGSVTVSFTPSDENNRVQGDGVTVTVSYELPLITPIIGPLISGSNSLNIERSTIMRVE